MLQLRDIISNIYPAQDTIDTIELLEKYGLESILDKIILKVQSEVILLQGQKNRGQTSISLLSGTILSGINGKLALITDELEKRSMELLLSDISHELLLKIIHDYKGDKKKLLAAISEGLKSSCEINGYDMDALLLVFPLHKFTSLASILESNIQRVVYSQKPIYYIWNGLPHALDELSRNLRDKKIIESTKGFKTLFELPEDNLKVKFDSNHKETIIVLFDVLHDRKLISIRGNKGHFMPIKLYAVDFDNNFLIENEPKTAKYTIKKNRAKWLLLKGSVEKWIDHLPVK